MTTFITPFGRFELKTIPFGISAAPYFFKRQMTRILRSLEGPLIILVGMMEDVLVFGRIEQEHDRTLEKVLTRLEESGMTLNKGMCELGVNPVTFLRHRVSGQGTSPDPEKVKAVTEMRQLGNKTELEFLRDG